MIKINEQVPDFTAEVFQNDEIRKVSLRDFRGKWLILLFYPADFTFVCPTELKDLAELYDKFKELGAEVVSVSTDKAWTHKAWHDTSPAIKKVKYPMMADPNGNITKMLGIYIDDEGVALRGTFIIDPDGVLKTIEIHNNDIGRSAKETLRKLQAAKFVRENGDNVCPASWEPGEETLKPGVDLVGKI